MNDTVVKGKVNSIQTMGTLDGPGVRFVVFMQGCNLCCGCCHNPETQSADGGEEFSAEELAKRAAKYKTYFGNEGGVTLSGGEPLLQPEFAAEFFKKCHELGINTCIDTSGSVINDEVLKMLEHTDRVLLDIKFTTDEKYREFAGCGMEKPLEFLKILEKQSIPVTLRQVIIPGLNDDAENIKILKKIASEHRCVDKIELLPFRKLCTVKYKKLGREFRFKDIPEPTPEKMAELEKLINE